MSEFVKTKRPVKLKTKMTADTFGAEAGYFEKHIRGKPLTVLRSYSTLLVVKDENGEVWNVFKSWVNVTTGLTLERA